MEKRFHKFADVKVYFYLCKSLSGFSAVGSAHVWGARGRWFESSNPDLQISLKRRIYPIFSMIFFCFYTITNSWITFILLYFHFNRQAVRTPFSTFSSIKEALQIRKHPQTIHLFTIIFFIIS